MIFMIKILASSQLYRLPKLIDAILQGLFDQRILHGGGKIARYVASKSNILGTRNSACELANLAFKTNLSEHEVQKNWF